MSDSFTSLRNIPFSNKLAKEELEQLLAQNNIPFEVEENSYAFDASFANNEFSKEYHFKIKQEDFTRVNDLLEKQTSNIISNLPADYYLFSFSREELMDIIRKPDEWNEIDVALAKKLLATKGFEISKETEEEIKEERITQLSQYTPISNTTLIIAYITAILSGGFMIPFGDPAFYAGPAASLFGLALIVSKKTLPDGSRIFSYEPKIRQHGVVILILGTLCASIWLYSLRYFVA